MQYITRLEYAEPKDILGNKARKLKELTSNRFRVPETYICLPQLFRIFQKDPVQAEAMLLTELRQLPLDGKVYAVRSSANIEDGVAHSFAGQFESYLDIQGLEGLKQAVIDVWESARAERVQSYLGDRDLQVQDVEMGVIIQDMVLPEFSGVAFSRNPTTGLDEIIIESTPGRGDLFLQHGITPERWIYKWGEWIETPQYSSLADEALHEIIQGTKSIENQYGRPVDLEWVYDGDRVDWVQVRDQTQRWITNIYSNRISREFLPGLIKPLLWSVNLPLVNTVWVDLFTTFIGKNDIDPLTLAKQFFGRAYFNMGVIGNILETLGMQRETLEIMMGIEGGGAQRPSFRPGLRALRHMPRMLAFGMNMLFLPRTVRRTLPLAEESLRALDAQALERLSTAQLMDRLDQVYALTQQIAYFNIVVPLIMQVHFSRLRRRLERFNIAFDQHNITGGVAELERYDPNPSLRKLHERFQALPPAMQAQLTANAAINAQVHSGSPDFDQAFAGFLTQFGHLSESGNDFTVKPWRENLPLVLQMVADAGNKATDFDRLSFEEIDLPLLQRIALQPLVRRARQFRIFRESIGYLYTFGYSQFRKAFLELGKRMESQQTIAAAEDIFYLTLEEVQQFSLRSHDQNAVARVRERKAELLQYKDIMVPDVIYGDQQPPPIKTEIRESVMSGTPTSSGYYQGAVRVIRSLRDFNRLKVGEVLVVPFSDVGWTPIFGKAGAVIAESGGILSHSSIVAREYGIPAVVSVNNACALRDGTEVMVDGYKGQVYIMDPTEGEQEEKEEA